MAANTRTMPIQIWRQGTTALFSTTAKKGFVCAICRTRRRQPPPQPRQQAAPARHRNFSSTSSRRLEPPASPSPSSSGLVQLCSRRLILVKGPDAAKFLQGIVTQNIFALNTNRRDVVLYSAILNAAGRMLYDVFIYPETEQGGGAHEDGSAFLVEVDAAQAPGLAKHLKRYKLRANLSVQLLYPGERTVWHAWADEDDNDAIDDLTRCIPSAQHIAKDPRAPGLGWRIVKEGEEAPAMDLPRAFAALLDQGEGAYHVRRFLLGVPEGQAELVPEKALPLEANLDVMHGVDFRKGCYVGQELTIRTRHRGVVRKRVLPVMLYAEDEAAPEQLEYKPHLVGGGGGGVDAAQIATNASISRVEKKTRSTGRWLRGVSNIGLALCRLDAMTDVMLPGETAATSYNPADEFAIETEPGEDGTGGGVVQAKVKAFVPDWLRRELNGQQSS